MDESTISFDEFKRLKLQIGTIKSAERIEKSDKLLNLKINLGDETRQIIAGIGEVFDQPEVLVGQQVPVLVNLEPKTMMGLESQGMLLAVVVDGKPILLHPDQPVPPGSLVS